MALRKISKRAEVTVIFELKKYMLRTRSAAIGTFLLFCIFLNPVLSVKGHVEIDHLEGCIDPDSTATALSKLYLADWQRLTLDQLWDI